MPELANVSTRWYKGLKSETDKKDLRDAIRSSMRVLNRFRELLEEDQKELVKKAYSETNYDKPQWDNYMADLQGSMRTLNKIKELIPEEK